MPVKRASKGRPRAKSPGTQPDTRPAPRANPPPVGEFEEGGAIGNLFDNMKDDTVVVVHRFDPEAGRQVLMYKLMPDEATDVEIQRLSGGGKYTTREHVRSESGAMVFGRQRLIVISGLPRMAKMPKSYEHPESESAPTKPEVGTVNNKTSIDDVLTAGILRLFTSQAEASETQAKMYQAMLARPQTDWGELLKAVAPIVVTLLKKDEKSDPLEMVTKIAELVKESTSSASSFKDTLSAMNEVLDIKERTAPVPEDAFTALAGNLPKILEIISSEQKTKGRMPTQEEVRRRLAPSSQPAGAEQMPAYAKLLKKYAPMLVRWAQEGKDPSLMGEFLFNSIPAQYHGVVREFLLRDDAEEMVYQAIPNLREFPQWTKDCFGTLADSFGIGEEEEEGEPDEAAEPGEEEGSGVEEMTLVEEVTTEEVTEE